MRPSLPRRVPSGGEEPRPIRGEEYWEKSVRLRMRAGSPPSSGSSAPLAVGQLPDRRMVRPGLTMILTIKDARIIGF